MNKISEIKTKIQAKLAADSYFAGFKILKDFDVAIWEATDIPCLNILSGEERAERLDQSWDRQYKRTLSIFIEACVKTNAPTKNSIDEVLGNIERVLIADPKLDNLVDDLEYDYMVSAVVNPGKSKLGVGNIYFTIQYIK